MNKASLSLLNIYIFSFVFILFIINSYLDINSNAIVEYIFASGQSFYENQTNFFIIKSFALSFLTLLFLYFIINQYFIKVIKKLNKVRSLFDNTTDAVYVVNLQNGQILDTNKRACVILGYTKNELLNKNIKEFRKITQSNSYKSWQDEVKRLKEKKYISLRVIHIKKDGSEVPMEANLSYIKNETEEYMIAVARDITKQLNVENKIHLKADELQRSQDLISKSALFTTSDLNGNIISISKAFEQLSGYKQDELEGKNHSIFRTPDTSLEFYENMWGTLKRDEQFVGEIKNFTKEKETYWIKVTIDPIFNDIGDKVGYCSYQEDISDKKELEYISSHDMLTQIYNRAEFTKRLALKIEESKYQKVKFGLIMIDVDFFKSVNDTYGHHIGDNVLKDIAKCFKSHIRKVDVLARWGGEEFVIIANDASIDDLKILVIKLQTEIMKTSFSPLPYITVSFGLTTFKDNDNELSIQKRADTALYEAKKNGRNRYEIKL